MVTLLIIEGRIVTLNTELYRGTSETSRTPKPVGFQPDAIVKVKVYNSVLTSQPNKFGDTSVPRRSNETLTDPKKTKKILSSYDSLHSGTITKTVHPTRINANISRNKL
ncbi:MAG TPA: hypothetical protein VJZ03_07625 [Candidatus Bathyarchaeia archaeon]|nr:hypothetical protein [Candidatus Bathyarchaeia archaeon]